MTDSIILPPSSKAIPLTQGKYAIVDSDDYDFLMQWKWYYNSGYAIRTQYFGLINGKENRKAILMHRLILNTPDGFETDHINGDQLDNRRCNLRICTHALNMWNQKPREGCASKYKGVSWHKANKNWRAYIQANGKFKSLGSFENAVDAALSYNEAAILYYGEFARLNIIEPKPV